MLLKGLMLTKSDEIMFKELKKFRRVNPKAILKFIRKKGKIKRNNKMNKLWFKENNKL